jgi:hypothetical protein
MYNNDLKTYSNELNTYSNELKTYSNELNTYSNQLNTYNNDLNMYSNNLKSYSNDLTSYSNVCYPPDLADDFSKIKKKVPFRPFPSHKYSELICTKLFPNNNLPYAALLAMQQPEFGKYH